MLPYFKRMRPSSEKRIRGIILRKSPSCKDLVMGKLDHLRFRYREAMYFYSAAAECRSESMSKSALALKLRYEKKSDECMHAIIKRSKKFKKQ